MTKMFLTVKILFVVGIFSTPSVYAQMQLTTFVGGQPALASQVNGNFSILSNVVNDLDRRLDLVDGAVRVQRDRRVDIVSEGFEVLRLDNDAPGSLLWSFAIYSTTLTSSFSNGSLSLGTVSSTGTGGEGGGPHQTRFTFGSDGSFNRNSDARLKTDIAPLTNVLEKLTKVRGVLYEWNDLAQGYPKGQKIIGVIAQEVEEVFPELVWNGDKSGYKAVDYGKLTSVLIEAVKELRAEKDAQVAALEARLTSKDTRIADLEARLAKIEEAIGSPSTPIQSSVNMFTDWTLVSGLLTVVGLVFGRYWQRRQRAV